MQEISLKLKRKRDTNNTGMEAIRICYLYWVFFVVVMITCLRILCQPKNHLFFVTKQSVIELKYLILLKE